MAKEKRTFGGEDWRINWQLQKGNLRLCKKSWYSTNTW
jgi:hypothetical protein